MTCTRTCLSPFRFREFPRPSIFLEGTGFAAYRTGKTASQTSAETVDKFTEKHGRSPGSIHGLSDRGDKLIDHLEYARRTYRAAQARNG